MKYMKLSLRDQQAFLAELEAMSDYLENVFSDLKPSDFIRPGPDGGFSPVEHVWHLVDLERDGFAERIRRLQVETHPVLPDFDGTSVAKAGNYKSRSIQKGVAEFRALRKTNVSTLRALSSEAWLRRGEQEGVGPVSLCDIPAMMAEHDESHRSEISEWIKASGPWRTASE
ncbi:MAG: DinB family protein [Arenicellales bacterium]